jgi:hypothetical protein
MNAVLFDTLKLAHRLKEAGFEDKQAEGAAAALGDALAGAVATKADLDALGARLEAKIDSRFSETVRWIFGAVILNAGVMLGLLKLIK